MRRSPILRQLNECALKLTTEPKHSRDFVALEKRRRAGLALLQSGETQAEAARRVGVSRQSLNRWVAAFRKSGSRGLTRGTKGRRPFLDERQRIEVTRLLVATARATRKSLPKWTLARTNHLLQEHFRVSYKRTSLIELLHEAGFTPRGPAGWYLIEHREDR